MSKLRLGVVFGGRSVEHEVSVVSAMELLAHADPERFEPAPFGVTRDGRWLTPQETAHQLGRDEPLFTKRLQADVPPLAQRPEILRDLAQCDAVFPLVHGVNGEDGTLQGMFEVLGLPYAGCGVAASAIGMDKVLQKELFVRAGLEVAPFFFATKHQWAETPKQIVQSVEQSFPYPVFVKPANGGSSVGVGKVRSREDLGDAMSAAFRIDRKVLVEAAVRGREVECGVLGNDEPEASPIGEVVPGGEFYDYAAKYIDDSARLIAPADLPEETAEELREAAITAFQAIAGEGFARVDFFLPDGEAPIVNEINTLPGFRPVSMFPKLWAVAGVTYRELISRVVDLAVERSREKEALGA
jgi:D-alanine-D-alanine ligase